MSSRIPGFYQLSPEERLKALRDRSIVDDDGVEVYRSRGLELNDAALMVENVVSTFALPCAAAVNFLINGRDYVVPMVVEEPSVVAAVSNMARLARRAGGFTAESDPSHMIGQIQLMNVSNPTECIRLLNTSIPQLTAYAQTVHPRLIARGGGIREMSIRHLVYDEPGHPREDMVVLHFVLDCVDAMGANMVNTVAEQLAPHLEEITGEAVGLRILSNLADQRCSRASVRLPFQMLDSNDLKGNEVAHRIAAAWRFAWADPYRAATHNKGVMNGIDAVALATGNDWRAIEAGAHAWCCRDGQYRPLTTWRVEEDALVGTIEIPLQFGTVGGPIRLHPTVRANLSMLGVNSARELSSVAAAVGLSQNLGALKALATEGIQCGHMRMHARNVAALAGARGDEIGRVVEDLVGSKNYSSDHAEQILAELRRE
jgi:hydroxymethylglutaryl-CoA reductase